MKDSIQTWIRGKEKIDCEGFIETVAQQMELVKLAVQMTANGWKFKKERIVIK